MSRPLSNLRLFVAAYPPEHTASELLAALDEESRRTQFPAFRTTRADQVHITLQFIGDIPSRELGSVTESVRRSAAGVEQFALAPQRLIALPERGPARLIAAQTDAPPPLLEIHRRLVHRLVREPRRTKEVFLPHFTLCRFLPGTTGPMKFDPIRLQVQPFTIDRIVLMRSTLSPEGAEDRAIEAVDLPTRA